MSLRRFNPKRDGSEKPIITALESAGASVTQLSGKGVADLLVGFRGLWSVLEVKTPGTGKLRPEQVVWIGKQRAQVHVVWDPAMALEAIGVKLNSEDAA